jgi:hypothetical protein
MDLKLAINARIPLISVETTDTINILEVLTHYAGMPITEYPLKGEIMAGNLLAITKKEGNKIGSIFYSYNPISGAIPKLYTRLSEYAQSIIFINVEDQEGSFAVGMVFPDYDLVKSNLAPHLPATQVEEFTPYLVGHTLKEITEIIRILMEIKGTNATLTDLLAVKKMLSPPVRGATMVNTTLPYNHPNTALELWLQTDGPIFLHCRETRLRPRGLLFYGTPGTGKTQGAKYLATQLGLPLYALEVGDSLGKYVGESEGMFAKALRHIDAEEPCVVLLDEVEKIFKVGDDSTGAVQRILSRLLWWLQERTSKTLVIMTTNLLEALPTELYRPGRIDYTMRFEGLHLPEGLDLVTGLINSFPHLGELVPSLHNFTINVHGHVTQFLYKSGGRATPSDITQLVFKYIKLEYLKAIPKE